MLPHLLGCRGGGRDFLRLRSLLVVAANVSACDGGVCGVPACLPAQRVAMIKEQQQQLQGSSPLMPTHA